MTKPVAYAVLAILATGALIWAGDAYLWRIASLVGLYAISAIGFQLVFGRLGLLMLAQGALFGAGAYLAAMATIHAGVSPWVGLLGAVCGSAALALFVAGPIARLESHYVALATLAMAQLGLLSVTHGGDWTGGSNGLYGVPSLDVLGYQVTGGPELTVLTWTGVGIALLAAHAVAGGYASARHATLRETPLAAASLGLDEGRTRLLLFPVAGALAGLAGALQAFGIGVVSPAVMRFEVMVTILTIAVVAGRGSFLGSVAAAGLLVPMPEVFRWLESYYLVAYGAALLLVITVFPTGLDGLMSRWFASEKSDSPEPSPLQIHGTAVDIRDLEKSFGGNRAVDGVTFSVAPGQILGLIGPNGSGKSTVLNPISGLERSTVALSGSAVRT